MTLDLGPIKERAERATGGTDQRIAWEIDADDKNSVVTTIDGKCAEALLDVVISHTRDMERECRDAYANAAFVVAAQPRVVLALVAEVEALRAALADERKWCDEWRAASGRDGYELVKAREEHHDARRAPKIGGGE